jgi:very-long-chain enoyl-CoA reductase
VLSRGKLLLHLERVPRKGGKAGAASLGSVELEGMATVDDLKAAYSNLPASRQEWRLVAEPGQKRGKALRSGVLSELGLKSGMSVQLKDLGPQVGYSTVFFWEYFGPILVYAAFYFLQGPIYGKEFAHSETQDLALIYFVGHYVKRIIETFFVHRFSHATMPIFNLYKNCSYYWAFAGFIAYFINHPLYQSPPQRRVHAALACAVVCQLSNLWCHVIQRNLRKPGEKGYKIPRGFLFNYVTCANYTAEIYGWLCFNIATQTLWGYIFMAAGAYQMIMWAIAKHKRLRSIFNGKDGMEKYPRRFIILPPFM